MSCLPNRRRTHLPRRNPKAAAQRQRRQMRSRRWKTLAIAGEKAAQAIATVAGEAPDADTAELIRSGLRLLAPKG